MWSRLYKMNWPMLRVVQANTSNHQGYVVTGKEQHYELHKFRDFLN